MQVLGSPAFWGCREVFRKLAIELVIELAVEPASFECIHQDHTVSASQEFSVHFSVHKVLCMTAGAVVQTLTNSSITPLTIFAFTFSIPYLQDSPDLGPQFVLGSAILVAGLFTYNSPKWRPWLAEKLGK